jgi:hypothetical protein
MSIIRWLLNGRPMHLLEYRFTDKVNGLHVFAFRDHKGRGWLAHHAWACFRVRDRLHDL